MDIEKIMADGLNGEVLLGRSDWLMNVEPKKLKRIYEKYERKFEELVPVFTALLGKPDITEQSEPDLCSELFCEAMRLVAWRHGEGYLVLAFGQHDHETPVFVSFGFREIL
jgi:hypothetical protein